MTAGADTNTCEAKSQLEYFNLPKSQSQVQDSYWQQYKPQTTIAIPDSGIIEFLIEGGPHYIDTGNIEICIKGKIVKSDGSDIGTSDIVAPVNNFLYSLFSQISIDLNDTTVTSNYNTNPYECIIDSAANYDTDILHAIAPNELFSIDNVVNNNITGSVNSGMAKRIAAGALSKEIIMRGLLKSCITRIDQYLPEKVAVRIRMLRARESYYLISKEGGYKYLISECLLNVRKVILFPEGLASHNKLSLTRPFKILMPQMDAQEIVIPAGLTNFTISNMYTGRRPNCILIAFVKNSAFNGSHAENPFNFHHYYIRSIRVSVNGQERPRPAMLLDYTKNDFLEPLSNLQLVNCEHGKILFAGFNRNNFATGNNVYPLNLTPDLCDEHSINQHCDTRVDFVFDRALPEPVSIIHWATFYNVIYIDGQTRRVLVQNT